MFSKFTIKRFNSFRRIRRAWYSLWLLIGVFAFCLAADWVCPCDPRAVTDVRELEQQRREVVEKEYDVRTIRFSVGSDGKVFDLEGPAPFANGDSLDLAALARYHINRSTRDGYVRYFCEAITPQAVSEKSLGLERITFPFRPCSGHPFGLDSSGRDVYARVVHGMRIALGFGLVLVFSGLLLGVVVGALEGFFGGIADLAGQRLTEIWSALPFLYVMIFIGSTVGRSFTVLLVCYGIFNWIGVSYYMRAEFLRLRSRQFVEAARVQGFGMLHIVFRQILPNALTPLVTLFPFLLMGAIGSLASLDFLGFGLPPMTPSCGELLAQAQQFPDCWWLVVFPAGALFLVMLLAVLVGEGLRDAFDPRQRSRIE